MERYQQNRELIYKTQSTGEGHKPKATACSLADIQEPHIYAGRLVIFIGPHFFGLMCSGIDNWGPWQRACWPYVLTLETTGLESRKTADRLGDLWTVRHHNLVSKPWLSLSFARWTVNGTLMIGCGPEQGTNLSVMVSMGHYTLRRWQTHNKFIVDVCPSTKGSRKLWRETGIGPTEEHTFTQSHAYNTGAV